MLWLIAALPPGDALDAARSASPRPAECRSESSGQGHGAGKRGLWSQARQPRTISYCRWLGRGYASLRDDPALALEAADRAHKLLPKSAAPAWLAGQALVALGRWQDADARFRAGFKLDAAGPPAPAQLQDAARAAVVRGDAERALLLYQRLVPQVSLLASQSRRHAVYVEAALARMAAGELDVAASYLGEARERRGAPGFSSYVLGALALVLDRQGREVEARAVARDAGGPGVLLRQLQYLERGDHPRLRELPVLPRAELHAMVAILAETGDERQEHWQTYLKLAPADGRFREHASKRIKGK